MQDCDFTSGHPAALLRGVCMYSGRILCTIIFVAQRLGEISEVSRHILNRDLYLF